jgi:very-short-patch-repair endonuclease
MSGKTITLPVSEAVDEHISELARRQRGYVRRVQLLGLGLRRHQIEYRVRIGRLIPVYAGVYAVGHLPTLPQDRAAGALLACGTEAVLSHGSAACVWGIFKRWQMPFEVTARTAHTRRGVRVHRARLERRDTRTQLGLPVTSPARTLLDISPRMTDKSARRAVNDLRRAGYLHLHELADVLARFPRAPGARRLRALLDVPGGGPTRSELEDRFIAFAERFQFTGFETNVRVAGRQADVWFREERLIVELDGYDFHSDRESYEGDRDNDATALALGIATVRITDPRIKATPEREADRLRKILRSRRTA